MMSDIHAQQVLSSRQIDNTNLLLSRHFERDAETQSSEELDIRGV